MATLPDLAPRRPPLCVPVVEASHMKLHSLHALTDAFHHELVFRNGGITGETRLVVPSAAPDTRDAVVREASVCQFFPDETTKEVLFHGGLPVGGAQNYQ